MKKVLIVAALLILGAAAYAYLEKKEMLKTNEAGRQVMENSKNFAKATFAGGCFWCMEPPYEILDGVDAVISGYIGGHKKDPTYEEVSSGTTGHTEAVEVYFDDSKITYSQLLDVFWKNIDPTTVDAQFVDKGTQYRTGIFYHDEEQKRFAEASKEALEKSGRYAKPIVTEITKATEFYPAEDYHQDYYKKSPVRYKFYRHVSGRDQYLDNVWGSERKK